MKRLSYLFTLATLAAGLLTIGSTSAQAAGSAAVFTPSTHVGVIDVHHYGSKYKQRGFSKRYYNDRPRRSFKYNRSYRQGFNRGSRNGFRGRSYNRCPYTGSYRNNYRY